MLRPLQFNKLKYFINIKVYNDYFHFRTLLYNELNLPY